MASGIGQGVAAFTSGLDQMIRIDEIWLSTQPMDMRAGMDTAMAQIMKAFGSIKPHCAYLFCNKRGHRMKVLVHDGLGIWLCARRLEQGKFHWAKVHQGETVALSRNLTIMKIWLNYMNHKPYKDWIIS